MTSSKNILILALNIFIRAFPLMIVSHPICFGEGEIVLNNENSKAAFTNLFILESLYNPGEYISGDLSSSGFVPYSSGPLPNTITKERHMYTFRGTFRVDPSLSKTQLSLYLSPCSYPYVIYINGVMIITRGSYGDYYQASSYETMSVQLRDGLLRYKGDPNEIAIQAFPVGDTSPLDAPVLSSEENTSAWAFVRNLFNVDFNQASFLISILIGLYFTLLFFARQFAGKHYLYFALMSFCFSLSYFNNAFTYNSVDEVFLEKLSYFFFPITVLFLTLFILTLTNIANKAWLFIVITIPVLASSFYTLTLNTKFEIDSYFNNYPLIFIMLPLLIFSFVILIISYIRTKKNSYLVILTSYVLNMIASANDIYYQLNFKTPYCWFVPLSYLAMLISIFIVLVREESSIFFDANRKRLELDRKNESMKIVLQKLESVSRNLIKSSTALEDNTKQASSIISKTSMINKDISKKLKTQLSEIERVTSQISLKMESKADKIPKAVTNQTAVVEETNRTVNGINANIEKILRSIILTENISKELFNIASNSKDIVKQSKDSIEKVSENTNYISEVLENIREIVEESNFLSVNASIESSYSGEAGKGFSILASEIRDLANKSKERLDLSQERLKQMKLNINDSFNLTEDVTSHLLTIIDKSRNSVDMIEKISKLMYEHKLESSAILEGTDSLLKETQSIKDMTDKDYSESEKMQQTLMILKKTSEDMSKLILSHEETENNIRNAVERIQEELSENLKTIEILKETFIIAGSENALQEDF